MKKFIIAIMCMFGIAPAYAENENAATSKEYVDTELATKQPTIPAEGANVVMTFDSTATDGIGTKQIYDESTPYASQTDALVTAETANAAVQMAINGEFYCKEYSTIDPTDCWLWGIKEPTPHSASKNLFNIENARVLYRNGDIQETKTSNGYTVTKQSNDGAHFIVVEFGDINDYLGKTLTISAQHTCVGTTKAIYNLLLCDDNGQNRIGQLGNSYYGINIPLQPDNNLTKIAFRLYAYEGNASDSCTYSNIQIEEGDTATAYEPYQNLYIPQNVQ